MHAKPDSVSPKSVRGFFLAAGVGAVFYAALFGAVMRLL